MIIKIYASCPNKIRNESQLNAVLQEILGDSIIEWIYKKDFFKSLKKLDKTVLSQLLKKIKQIFQNPDVGKHLSSNRKGQQEVYVADSFRLYYSFCKKENRIEFLEFSHKKHQ